MTSKATAVCVYVEQQITSSMAWVRIIFSLLHHNIIPQYFSPFAPHRNKAARKLSKEKQKINLININHIVSVFSFVTCSEATGKFRKFPSNLLFRFNKDHFSIRKINTNIRRTRLYTNNNVKHVTGKRDSKGIGDEEGRRKEGND